MYVPKPLKGVKVVRADPDREVPARLKNPPKMPKLDLEGGGPGKVAAAPVGSLEKKLGALYTQGAMKRRLARGRA